MKKKRLKIKIYLFASLVVILGMLTVLYAAFCKGKGYNRIKVELESVTQAPSSTEPSTEAPTEAVVPEEPPVSEEESTSEAEEESTDPPVDWSNYNPVDILSSENWSLTLINRSHPLAKSYSPSLAPVIEGSSVTADSRVAEAYQKMYNDALAQNVILTPYAGYCSYSRQQTNYDNKVQAFMLQNMTKEEAEANAQKRIEPAGCSENGAGLSVDISSASAGFASTNEYKWLTENAHNYGFILRYPEDKTDVTGMIYQPWHWRYVGVDAAKEIKQTNKCLEEYLGAV